MRCPYCEANVEEGAVICPSCHQILPILELKEEVPQEEVSKEDLSPSPVAPTPAPPPTPKKGMKKRGLMIAIAIAVLVVVLVTGLVIEIIFKEKEVSTLSLIPGDTAFVASISLNPKEKSWQNLELIGKKLLGSDFSGQASNWFQDYFGLSPDLNFKNDITSWLDKDLIIFSNDFSNVLFAVSVKNKGTALQFVENLKEKLAAQGIKVKENSHKNYKITSFIKEAADFDLEMREGKNNFLPFDTEVSTFSSKSALFRQIDLVFIKGNIFIAQYQNLDHPLLLEEVIDKVSEKNFVSIVSRASFGKVSNSLNDSLLKIYFSWPASIAKIKSVGGLSGALENFIALKKENIEALGLGFSPKTEGLKIKLLALMTAEGFNENFQENKPELAGKLPKETVIYWEQSSLVSGWEDFNKKLILENKSFALALTSQKEQIKKITGIDFDQDIFGKLNGRSAFAVIGGKNPGINFIAEFEDNKNALEFAKKIKIGLEKVKVKTVEEKEIKLADGTAAKEFVAGPEKQLEFSESEYLGSRVFSLDLRKIRAENPAIPFNLNQIIPDFFNLVVADRYAVFSTSLENLKQVLATIKKQNESLETVPEFRNLIQIFPEKLQTFCFLKPAELTSIMPNLISSITSVAEIGKISPPVQKEQKDAQLQLLVLPFLEKLGALAAASYYEENQRILEIFISVE